LQQSALASIGEERKRKTSANFLPPSTHYLQLTATKRLKRKNNVQELAKNAIKQQQQQQ
jgi:hypothetical protein